MGSRFTATALHEATQKNDIVRVREYIEYHQNNPDAIDLIIGEFWHTALITAASNGQLDMVDLLIDAGANVNKCDKRKYTALHYAATNSHVNVVEVLLAHGANANAKNVMGYTPLHLIAEKHFATSKGFDIFQHSNPTTLKRIIALLLAKGADVNQAANDGSTPLHTAAKRGVLSVGTFFIDHGADVNRKAIDGTTPLINAAHFGHVHLVKLLLARGADASCTATNERGNEVTAADIAIENGHKEAADFIKTFQLDNPANTAATAYKHN